jgi:hypothetical protein
MNTLLKKIIPFTFLAVLFLIIVIFFVIFMKQKNTATNNLETQSEKTTTGSLLPTTENPSALPKTINQNQSNISDQAELSYNFLVQNPNTISAIRKIVPGFKPSDMFISTPLTSVNLSSGEQVAMLWGCEEHNCGGTTMVVAYIQSTEVAYVLTEKTSNGQDYEILDDPPQEIRDMLLRFYKI